VRRRHVDEQLDPIAVAIATPDEPFDGEDMLVLDGRRVSWRELGELQAARRRQLGG
jgi:hypothetical protein